MAGFAYRDKTNLGVLHIVGDMATAQEYASGKIVPTGMDNKGGYPVVAGHTVCSYANGQVWLDGNGNQVNEGKEAGILLSAADTAVQGQVNAALATLGL